MNRRQTIPKELRYTRNQFDNDFPNDDVCLEQIKQSRWPNGMIDCETCSISKATQVISQQTEVDEPENGIPFDRMTWDMVEFNPGYNGHKYMSHFQCQEHLFNIVFTHQKKTDALQLFEKVTNFIECQYKGKT